MFMRITEGNGVIEDPDPWVWAPEEAGVEWDRDVAPYLEGMPDGTRVYWRIQTIAGHLYLSVSFASMINNHSGFKSVLWTRPGPESTWPGGWQSNYGKASVAEELDWTKHPGLGTAPW